MTNDEKGKKMRFVIRHSSFVVFISSVPPVGRFHSLSPLGLLCALALSLSLAGCNKEGKPGDADRVVLYTSVDQPIAEPILRAFEQQTGIRVQMQTDTEATKSSGLAARLQAEKANPQADVWWGNEIFHTINLAENGVLTAYDSPSAADIPAKFKDPDHRWAGTCLRARVIAVHTGLADVKPAQSAPPTASDPGAAGLPVKGLKDLRDPMFKDRVAIARPTAGTTGGHVAALYVLWGEPVAEQFFRGLRANGCKVLGGNSVVAEQVGQGTVWIGLTDNDDVESAQAAGGHLRMVLPDQGPDGQGTLTIPCTVGLVAGAKHPEPAKKLVDYLLSRDVERKLIEAKFGRYPVRGGSGAEAVKTMDVDYRAVAKMLPRAVQSATDILEGRK
jgi:iron(III) transport system substrate-binding protein